MTGQALQFDPDLIRRYDQAGPRYTSYPTALELHEGFTDADYLRHVEKSNTAGGPLSLYFHIPFCDTVCFYCACNKIITKNRGHAEPYLDNLCQEIALQGALFDRNRIIEQALGRRFADLFKPPANAAADGRHPRALHPAG